MGSVTQMLKSIQSIPTILAKLIIAILDFTNRLSRQDIEGLSSNMEFQNKFVEHRRCHRRLVFVHASIVHPLQTEHLNCIVHNISEDGALLDVAQAMKLPSSFWLRLEAKPVLRLCTVAWRSNYELGVEFGAQILERRSTERLAHIASLGPNLVRNTAKLFVPLASPT